VLPLAGLPRVRSVDAARWPPARRAGNGDGATLGTLIGRQGPSESVTLRGDRATAPYEYIFNSSHRPKLCTALNTEGRCAMWRVGTPGSLIFVGLVALMVAVSLMLLLA
jgi:hypothetical protein